MPNGKLPVKSVTTQSAFLNILFELQSFTEDGKQKVGSTQLGCFISPSSEREVSLLKTGKAGISLYVCLYDGNICFESKIVG